MNFHKHPRKPSTYIAEDNDSGHRYTVHKVDGGSWELNIDAGAMPVGLWFGRTKQELIEVAQRHNTKLWIDNMTRLHGKSGV